MHTFPYLVSAALVFALTASLPASADHHPNNVRHAMEAQASSSPSSHALQTSLARLSRQVRDLMHAARNAQNLERTAQLDRVLSQLHSTMRRHGEHQRRIDENRSLNPEARQLRLASTARILNQEILRLRQAAESVLGEPVEEAWYRIRTRRLASS